MLHSKKKCRQEKFMEWEGKNPKATLYIGTLLKVQHGNSSPLCPSSIGFWNNCYLFGIDSISLLQSSTVIEGNVSPTQDHNSNNPFGGVSYRFSLLFIIAHRFSVGFKYGDWVGQDKTLSALNLHPFCVLVRVRAKVNMYLFCVLKPTSLNHHPFDECIYKSHTFI